MYSTMNIHVNRKEKDRRRRYFCQISILIILTIIVSMFLVVNLILFLRLPGKSQVSKVTDTIPDNEIIISTCRNCPTHYIYIDIGCFNGETIEHFIHFIPNSTFYNIITFEPDPKNYRLCQRRLTQKKYSNININILQKAAWIRNEKVLFHTNRGQYSRININKTVDNGNNSEEIDAIDFSSWLARLAKPNKTKIFIKMSMPGAEVLVLEKMVLDDTLGLAEKYEVEWTDRDNLYFRPTRIYVQLMLDSYGFSCLYFTRLQDVRNIFQINGTSENVAKFYDWTLINASDTYAHYLQRPDK